MTAWIRVDIEVRDSTEDLTSAEQERVLRTALNALTALIPMRWLPHTPTEPNTATLFVEGDTVFSYSTAEGAPA